MTWTLTWKPNRFRWSLQELDQTPDDPHGFTVPARDSYVLYFGEMEKLSWDHTVTTNRTLLLSLHLYGGRRPKVLKIYLSRKF